MILKRINNRIYQITGVMAALLLLGIVVLVFSQVLCRYVLGFALQWASELVVFGMVWMVFISCSMGYKADAIVGLTIVTDRLPVLAKQIVNVVVAVTLILFFAITTYANGEIIHFAARKSSSILGINMRLIYVAWSVSASLMALYAVEKIVDAGKEIKTILGNEKRKRFAEEKEGETK